MMKILLLENPHTVAGKTPHDANIEVQHIDGSLDENTLIGALRGCQMARIHSRTNLSRRVFESCPDLICARTFTIDTNQIDLKATAAHGVAVFNAPYSNTRSVAELTISEVIALTRLLPVRNAHMQRADWQRTTQNSHEVCGKTLGIIGYSSAGTQLSILAEVMGIRVQFYDLVKKLPIGNAKQCGPLEEVLQGADFVNLHVDGRPTNHNMSRARGITMIKPGLGLLNLSRGFVVDVDALVAALNSGHLGGCAVDALPEGPLKNGGSFESPLLGKENTILTPHIGGSTLGAQEDIGSFISTKIYNYIQAGEAVMSMNMSTLSLQSIERTRYRMNMIHRSALDIVGHISQVIAAADVDAGGQILGTNGEVGYMIAGTASKLPVAAMQDISAMDTTVHCRVIPLPGFTRVDAATVN